MAVAASSMFSQLLLSLSNLRRHPHILDIIPVDHFHQTCTTVTILVDGPVLQFSKTLSILSRWIQGSKVDPVSYRPRVSDLITMSHMYPSGPEKQQLH